MVEDSQSGQSDMIGIVAAAITTIDPMLAVSDACVAAPPRDEVKEKHRRAA